MNERIKELSDIAYMNHMERNPHSSFGRRSDYDKEFAELIVRECLKIVEPTEDSGDEWCVTLKGTAQEIKEHFGVEE